LVAVRVGCDNEAERFGHGAGLVFAEHKMAAKIDMEHRLLEQHGA
jgi:hypothetical protein